MIQPKELIGGESAYCFNKSQLNQAYDLVNNNQGSSRKIEAVMEIARERLSRNEQAALAFVLIDTLLGSKPGNKKEVIPL